MTARRNLEWSMGAAGPVLEALAVDEPRSWRDLAACAETDPEIFFPEKGGSTRDGKKVCAGCTVRAECLSDALEWDERFGIRGGLSERQRRKLRPPAEQTRTPVTLTEKTCPSCSQTKSADEFWRNRRKADGLANWCIACHVEREPRRHRKTAA